MDCTSIVKPPKSMVLKSGRVRLNPGEEVGEHVTDKREELLVILGGTACVINEAKKITLQAGETYYISEGKKHNVINEGGEMLEYVYVVSLFE